MQELSAWMVWCHAAYSLADSAAFVSTCDSGWEQGDHYSFVIMIRKTMHSWAASA